MSSTYTKIDEELMKIFTKRPSGLLPALLATTLLTLSACGGGGGGGSGDSATGNAGGTGGSNTGNADGTGNSVNQVQEMKDLSIARANELRAVTELNIEVRVTAARSYLSICPDPGAEITVSSLDYDSCLVRSPLDGSSRSFTLDLPNHVDQLVAILWFYDAGKQPLIQRWQRNSGGSFATTATWQITDSP